MLLPRYGNTRAQQADTEGEERQPATLRSIRDGVITCNMQGRTVSLNAVAETMTGWSSGSSRTACIGNLRIITPKPMKAENPVIQV